jgi:hypothetical protein
MFVLFVFIAAFDTLNNYLLLLMIDKNLKNTNLMQRVTVF